MPGWSVGTHSLGHLTLSHAFGVIRTWIPDWILGTPTSAPAPGTPDSDM